MTATEIRHAVGNGKKVCYKSSDYIVEKWADGYNIVCKLNEHAIGLTWEDGVTLNGKEDEFYIAR